jgi:preprotein translocase subunit SecY
MQMRPVPRNIDKPNRTPEYVIAFLAVYFTTRFVTQATLISLMAGFFATYFMYKLTMDKPEGMAMRFLYRQFQIGGLRPTPKVCKRLEI